MRATPDVDVMLVDIMMPGDGRLRDHARDPQRFRTTDDLPIVAVTAKAMKGDREKCLEAGATDYVSKPVDVDQLLAVLRVQLGRTYATRPRCGLAGNGAAPRIGPS